MHIERRESDDVTIIDFVGNIKTNDDYAIFKKAIDDVIQEGRVKLILNFRDVRFINSSGLGRLILAAKKARESNGSLKIVKLSEDLRELFSFTRLDTKIPIFASEEEAIDSFR